MGFSGGITLKGENLGERHRYLNNLVKNTGEDIHFDNVPETKPIDRIFKIDLANQRKNVNYIIQTLKDDDMLYVSRALKCFWLLDVKYDDIINPVNLEANLFPKMITPAINQTKHWIQANLKNQERSREFYLHYKSNFEESIKYLRNCSGEFIVEEIINIIDKITPNHLKTLCEVNPKVGKVYFECTLKNRDALERYVNDESNFFKSLKCILKSDGNLYLELVERYFNDNCTNRLSPKATRYILKYYKHKFIAKRELYTSQVLNVNTLALCLSSNECKDLVLHLARAEYLSHWFTYQNVEPLIKRVVAEERAALKKLVFVDKCVGEKVEEWPYEKPCPPKIIDHARANIFVDNEHYAYEYECYDDETEFPKKKMLKALKCRAEPGMMCYSESFKRKTLLDQLFDRYRFVGFSKTYKELLNRLQSESTIEGRQSILLVLVSKSGGIPAQVQTLVKLLVDRHKNEPSNLRAAIIRSLVKRVCFWRMPDDIWNQMLEFAHGLGLDGHNGEPLCVEGLHAVILRHVLKGTTPTKEILEAYRKNFSTFKEYDLKGSEIQIVKDKLPSILLEWPNEFLDVVSTYKININDLADAVDILAKSAQGNEDLVSRLFDKRIARRQLIADTFKIKQFEASYINALRHDVSLLTDGEIFASLASKEKTNHDRFLQSLITYFGESNGLADKHLTSLEEIFKLKPKLSLVRPIAMLSPNDSTLTRVQELVAKKSKENSKLATAFKDNLHKSKPLLNIGDMDWRIIGSKAIANRVLSCRSVSLAQYLKSCLKWRATTTIGLRLALNTSFEVETFINVAATRPKVAVSVAASYFFNKSRTINPEIWKIVKDIIIKFNFKNLPRKVLKQLENEDGIPKNIEVDYWATVYQAFINADRAKAMPALCRLEKVLHKVDTILIHKIVNDFIKNDLIIENLTNYSNLQNCGIEFERKPGIIMNATMCLYMRIVAKYLLLSTTEDEQRDKIENTLNPFFDRIEKLWKKIEDKSYIAECLYDFLLSLKYTVAFVDQNYVSCMPVFEQIINRLQTVMPRKEYLDKYMKIHFTILYFKAIQYAIEQDKNIFENEYKTDAMKVVGYKFGQYIGREIKELANEFFPSIVDIYKKGLKTFFEDYIPYTTNLYTFIAIITKGILENDNVEAHLVAEYIFKKYKANWDEFDEIFDKLKDSKYQEVKFFFNADLHDRYYYY